MAETTGSAGSVTLIAQALLPPLLKAEAPATIILKGGTHVPWSPPAHYLSHVFLPALAVDGGGGGDDPGALGLVSPGRRRGAPHHQGRPAPDRGSSGAPRLKVSAFRALSAAAQLPEHVARRQAARLAARLGEAFPVEVIPAGGQDPGSLVFLWGPRAGFAALGARGKPAEQVADDAVEAYLAFRASGAALDRHLADQILIYLALAQGPSSFTTEAVTSHLLTNVWVIEQFLGPTFEVKGSLGERGEIFCQGHK